MERTFLYWRPQYKILGYIRRSQNNEDKVHMADLNKETTIILGDFIKEKRLNYYII